MVHHSSRLGALLGALVLACAGNTTPLTAGADGLRLGVFDSRAVAIAYANSPDFSARMADLHGQLERARADGDAGRVAELQALGPALQQQLHRQGFSTAPVDELLAPFAERLPALADDAGVDALVSRWALTWQRPGAATIDVTDQLVALFEPDARALDWIADLKDTEPVPLDELDGDQH